METGLVLGGGGIVGIAWEIGVLYGMEQAGGFRAADATVIVGTSAGSVVGSRVRLGTTVEDLLNEQKNPPAVGGADATAHLDVAALMKVFQTWVSEAAMTPRLAQKVGQLALTAPTQSEDEWLASFSRLLGTGDWPDGDLRVTGVSTSTGERIVWNKSSGASLTRAVAASCAVPGMFPPVSVNGDRYMDGGVWSGSNADVLQGSGLGVAVFIGPMVGETELGRMMAASLERERELLAAEGIALELVCPGPRFAQFGANLMDPAGRLPALDIGIEDGRLAIERFGAALRS